MSQDTDPSSSTETNPTKSHTVSETNILATPPPTSPSAKVPSLQRVSASSTTLSGSLRSKSSKKSHFNPLHKFSSKVAPSSSSASSQKHRSPTSSISALTVPTSKKPHHIHSHSLNAHIIPPKTPHKSSLTGDGNVSSIEMGKAPSTHSIFKIGRKVSKFAGDLALGSTNIHSDEEDKKFQEFKLKRQRERDEKKKKEIDQIKKHTSEKGVEAYLEHFRFFVKYMDEADYNDPVNYAITRRDLWLTWYKRFLTGLREEIKDYEILIRERETLQRQSVVSASSSFKQKKNEAEHKFRTKLHDLSSITPSIDSLTSNMFHDKRIILILLWHLQMTKKLLDQPTMIHREIVSKLKKITNESLDPSKRPELPEILVVTCNKMLSDDYEFENKKQYTEGSIFNAHVEFLNGWQVRHDNPNLHTNFVTVTGRFNKIVDYSNTGYLKPEVLEKNPSFQKPLFGDDFFDYQISGQELDFLKGYSSFTSPAMYELPLRDNSQSCITCPDFTLLATHDNIKQSLIEFYRVLKPDGVLQFTLWDIELLHTKYNYNDPNQLELQQQDELFLDERPRSQFPDANEYVRYIIWHKLTKFTKERGRLIPNMTSMLIPLLKSLGYKKVRYSYVGYPKITSISENTENMTNSPPSSNPASGADFDYRGNNSNQDRLNSVLTTDSNKGYKDLRMNSFFEFYANYLEFLCFSKILSVYKFTNSMKFNENNNGNHDLMQTPGSSFSSSSTTGTQGSKLPNTPNSNTFPSSFDRSQSVSSPISSPSTQQHHPIATSTPSESGQTSVNNFTDRILSLEDEVDPEEIKLIKLFIDYKLNGAHGKLIKEQILNGTGDTSNNNTDNDKGNMSGSVSSSVSGMRTEGVNYTMVLIAEK